MLNTEHVLDVATRLKQWLADNPKAQYRRIEILEALFPDNPRNPRHGMVIYYLMQHMQYHPVFIAGKRWWIKERRKHNTPVPE